MSNKFLWDSNGRGVSKIGDNTFDSNNKSTTHWGSMRMSSGGPSMQDLNDKMSVMSNGVSVTKVGSQYLASNGKRYTKVGNTLLCSDGNRWNASGNMTDDDIKDIIFRDNC